MRRVDTTKPLAFRDPRASLAPAITLGALGFGLGALLVGSPESFIRDSSLLFHRGITSTGVAVTVGVLVFGLTLSIMAIAFRRARARPPALVVGPTGLTIPAAGPGELRLCWDEVARVETEWEGQMAHLVVVTHTGTVRVPSSAVAADLDRVAATIEAFKATHLGYVS